MDVDQSINLIQEARMMTNSTPFFYTSKDVLRQNYFKFIDTFPNTTVFYAVKANADPSILQHLNFLGSSFEAASYFEVKDLLELKVPAHKIMLGTSVKKAEHISKAFKSGVEMFAADSLKEVEKLAANAPGSKICIRAAVDDTDSVFSFSERFGAPIDEVEHMVRFAKDKGLLPYGLSFHVGSQAKHASHWKNAIDSLRPIIENLMEDSIKLEVLNIGGGFPVSYFNHSDVPTLEDIAENVEAGLSKLPYEIDLIVEPGRAIVATATVLVTEIISSTVRNGENWLVLDGGIYNCLYEAMIHQGTTRYQVHCDSDGAESNLEYTIAGPTGDSLDIVSKKTLLPSNLTEGDRLYFENAGAYTVTMSSPFNGFPKPNSYVS